MAETVFEKDVAGSVPLPMCVVDESGKIVSCNAHMNEVFLYDGLVGSDFFQLTGVKIAGLTETAESSDYKTIERNGKSFRLFASMNMSEQNNNIFVFFDDVTSYEDVRKNYEEGRLCCCIVRIDNYDELMASTLPDMRMDISSQLDKTIRKWASEIRGSIIKHKEDEYVIYFQYSYLKKMREDKFPILDEARSIESEADFPVSLSIGIGVLGEDFQETEDYAVSAIDMALGRGGDQAVVKEGEQTDYYGGMLQTVEKTNKGRSRVIAHRLNQLIDDADRVMIMGHRNPDMDCFGSAMGMFRLCKMQGRDATIVLSEVNDSLQLIYDQAGESEKYNFANGEKAQEMADGNTLLIVVDTHRRSFVDCPELLEKVGHIAVIDHHRRSADIIQNTSLQYIESYASSASELVAEILQYAGKKRALEKLEAEALLGGITIDTNRFAVKTGVRTFEAAAWLRRSGADTTEVKRFFQVDTEAFKVRAHCISSATIHEDGVATSICRGNNRDAQIIHSQVADELLNMKGVRASFVTGRNEQGETVISARSLGEVNVQVIMEKMGGGGHLTTAGAQGDLTPKEALEEIRNILEELAEKR